MQRARNAQSCFPTHTALIALKFGAVEHCSISRASERSDPPYRQSQSRKKEISRFIVFHMFANIHERGSDRSTSQLISTQRNATNLDYVQQSPTRPETDRFSRRPAEMSCNAVHIVRLLTTGLSL